MFVETDSTRINWFVVDTKIPLIDLDKEAKSKRCIKNGQNMNTVKAAKNKQRLGIVVPFSKEEDNARIAYSILYTLRILSTKQYLSDDEITKLINKYDPENINKTLTKICDYLCLYSGILETRASEISEVIDNAKSDKTMLIKALQTFLLYAYKLHLTNVIHSNGTTHVDYLLGDSSTDITFLFVIPSCCDVSTMYKQFTRMTGNIVRVYNDNGENFIIEPSNAKKVTKVHIEVLNCKSGKDAYNICLASGLLYMRNRFDYVANFNIYTSTPLHVDALLEAIENSNKDLIQLPTIDTLTDESYIIRGDKIPNIFTVTNKNVILPSIDKKHTTIHKLDTFPYIVHLLNKKKEDLGGTKIVYLAGNEVIVEDNKITGGYKEIDPWFVLCVFLIAAIVIYLISRICNECMHKQCMYRTLTSRCMQK